MKSGYKAPKGAINISMDIECLNDEQKKLLNKRNKTRPKEPRKKQPKLVSSLTNTQFI